MPSKTSLQKSEVKSTEQAQVKSDATLVSPVDFSAPATESTPMATKKNTAPIAILILLVAIVGGIGTGYAFSLKASSGANKSSDSQSVQAPADASKVEAGKVYGAKDASAFKDSAEGVLIDGGVNGEGSHHIVREGGESQNVYLTSSVVDLKSFEGHKVEVKGETFKAQKAGWLMDVGQVKVIELNAQLPAWAQKAMEKEGVGAGEQ